MSRDLPAARFWLRSVIHLVLCICIATSAANALAQAKDFRFRMGRLPGEQGYRIQGRLREDIQSILGSVSQNPGAPTAGELLRIKEMQGELAKMKADWEAFLKSIGK